MRLKKILLSGSLLLSLASYGQTKKLPLLREQLLDDHWLFKKDSLPGAEKTDFPETGWKTLHLPHDWAIEDLPGQNDSTIIGPFYKYSPAQEHGAYVVGGTGWYRKSFALPAIPAGQTVAIRFEGVYMDSDVWINGHYLGNHPYGYTPFTYDLTPYLAAPGKKNVVAVRVKNEGINSRWYTGAGIYRHVHLEVLPADQLVKEATFITFPEAGKTKAIVQVSAAIISQQDAGRIVEISLRDSSGQVVATAAQSIQLKAKDTISFIKQLTVLNPALWSPGRPYLYTTEIKLSDTVKIAKEKVLDALSFPTGIRRISITATKGFLLNGEKVLLKGGCLHHDNGLLGAAAFDRAEERKVELMKANGFNAIRTSHNPPSEKFLEACDRLGMLVIDELFDMWTEQKHPQDYHRFFAQWWQQDLRSVLLRDRNHPSVIMWSIGNEIPERADKEGLAITKAMIHAVRQYDTTRAITEAVPEFWERPYQWQAADPVFALLDVAGYNYQWKNYALDERRVPGRVMVGTETLPADLYDTWNQVQGLPFVIGDFVWTAMDYLGEAGIGHSTYTRTAQGRRTFPWINAFCGDIDLIGNKKPQSFYRDIVWRNSPVEMLVHAPVPEGKKEKVSRWGWPDESDSWTWRGMNGKNMQVRVFTRARKIDLILNDFRVATKEVSDSTPLTVTFDVPYAPGQLTAFAYDSKGNEIGIKAIATANPPTAIRLTADHTTIAAGNGSLAYVKVEVTDDQGRVVPDANLPLQISISGNGSLAGAGNACPDCPASFQQPKINSYKGYALVILRANEQPGNISVEVKSKGLKTAKIDIKTK
ncbi:glycoside hydrolase family 2 TIM barrel-domain containing protein [Chitinophaga pinensis]|uniref:Beta-galactosidase n=1 Tax=Chitinophaga pinensis (strain ATCC 43595 / DSM 2588 / LMG 13176 / NBRC 15968 / NCIMB 11800 / UQM 2034) TaxID=485918 RepID=A0A979FYS7_CHIPD|nr:glycoside hydrolase family 2 TIM barrel-domain containing protein [Chitinophaga pinensis]ACU57609.1 Beta-galactosidase [Chitinophaga pinensis DSM 2588]